MDSYDDDGNQWDSSNADEEKKAQPKSEKKNNVLPLWGNERTMNLNPLILTNIQSSHYFKVNLYELKTYHEVIDEIYYKVTHLEPWEKGSRKTAGQTGMCGGVRGVGAGGIVSTAYCLLYKLFTLKLTRKQLNGLIAHPDSPYIRGLGFMYIRYTQPPADLWDWYEPYLDDPEELDVKAGGGQTMTIGEMLRVFMNKLEWFSTLFPRIPVPIQQKLEKKMSERFPPVAAAPRVTKPVSTHPSVTKEARHIPDDEVSFGEAERFSRSRRDDYSPSRDRGSRHSREKRAYSPRPRDRSPRRSPPHRDRSPRRDDGRHRGRHIDKDVYRSKDKDRHKTDDFLDELRREKERQRRDDDRSRERHRDRNKESSRHKHHRSRS